MIGTVIWERAVSSSIWDRLGALSGILSVGLIAGYAILTDPYDPATNPNPTQPSALLAEVLVNNREQARLGAYLGLAGVFLLFWFLGYLRRHLQRAEGEAGWLASVAYGGGLVGAGMVLVAVSFSLATSELSNYGDDTQVAKVFFVYGWNAASVLAPPFGALVAATTAAGLRYRALPRWFGWVSLLITILTLAMSVTMPGIGGLISLVWIGLTSIVLLLRTWRAPRDSQA